MPGNSQKDRDKIKALVKPTLILVVLRDAANDAQSEILEIEFL
jgi:hypothetical protein